MKHTGTLEFRCFRSSTNKAEIEASLRFAERFVAAALNDGPSVKEILSAEQFTFPAFVWNINEYSGWVRTKWDKDRSNKKREYVAIT